MKNKIIELISQAAALDPSIVEGILEIPQQKEMGD